MSILSHVQIPNGILKYFRDEADPGKRVWYLDISSGQILQKASNRLGTQKNLYNSKTEEFWNSEIESKITDLNAKVRKYCSQNALPSISSEDAAVCKRYVKAAMIRSNLAYDTFKATSLTADMCSGQDNHAMVSYFGMLKNGTIDSELEKMDVTVLVNKTGRNFVVPRNCFYYVFQHDESRMIVPISPKIAYLLCPTQSNFEGSYRVILDVDTIAAMNVAALNTEVEFNKAFVASSSRQELIFLQSHLEEIKERNDY